MIRSRRHLCAGLAALVLLTAPALAEPALWSVRQGDATVYLFGTVHVLRPDTRWESARFAQVFAASEELWVEVSDLDAQKVGPLVGKFGFDATHPLSTKLTPEQLERVDRAAKAAAIPGGGMALEPMRPWLAGLTLSVVPVIQAGFDPASGIDDVLQKRAIASGKKVQGLETVADQIHFFADLPEDVELQILLSTLDDVDAGMKEFDRLVDAWSRGALAEEEAIQLEPFRSKYGALYDVLLVKRNAAFADRIATLLEPGHGVSFVAVGELHFVGPDSVQEALARRGIATTREQ